MPDTKFNWENLKEHLRKYAWIYLIGIVVCLIGSNLLWTTTRPRIPDDQLVLIFLADSYSNSEPLDSIAADVLERTQEFDDTLLQVEFQNLMYSDPSIDYTGSMVLMTRLAVGEGDAFFASQAVMDALVSSEALMPLDEAVEDGWMAGYDLEPYYATIEDEETGETTTFLAGLRIDSLNALWDMNAFNNTGAYLAIPANGTNPETTLYALEVLVDDLVHWEAEEETTDTVMP